MSKRTVRGNGRIRCFLLGMVVMGIILGFLKSEITRLEVQVIKPAIAKNQEEMTVNCILKIDPLFESALEN